MKRLVTPKERVMTALAHEEPDRVPFFLPLTMHGSRELGLRLPDFLADPIAVVEAQIRLRERHDHDLLLGFTHASREMEAWGCPSTFHEDGPPNAGPPLFRTRGSWSTVSPPAVAGNPALEPILDILRRLRARGGPGALVVGVAVSPWSLPTMQLGMGLYLESLMLDPRELIPLWQANTEFFVSWANAQLAAGADLICIFDPMASSQMVPRDRYEAFGVGMMTRAIARLRGPTATHLASAPVLSHLDLIASTGTAVISSGATECPAEVKLQAAPDVTVLGNLNGVAMPHWSPGQARDQVRRLLTTAAPGGGFILTDSHGEIPLFVPEETLAILSETVHREGRYPIQGRHDDPE